MKTSKTEQNTARIGNSTSTATLIQHPHSEEKKLFHANKLRMKKFRGDNSFTCNYFELRLQNTPKRRVRRYKDYFDMLAKKQTTIQDDNTCASLSPVKDVNTVDPIENLTQTLVNTCTMQTHTNILMEKEPTFSIITAPTVEHADPWKGLLPLKPVHLSLEEVALYSKANK